MVHRRFVGSVSETKSEVETKEPVSEIDFEDVVNKPVVKLWGQAEAKSSKETEMNGLKPADQDETAILREKVRCEVSKRMGELLLKGHTMLDQYCETCMGILMESRAKVIQCLQCTIWQEFAPPQPKPEPMTEMDSISDHEPSPKRIAIQSAGPPSAKDAQLLAKMEISEETSSSQASCSVGLYQYASRSVANKLKWACDALDACTHPTEVLALIDVVSSATKFLKENEL
ncbi:hypothetical protein L596_019058 [Steinernema carpocapsae]|uniref:Uncharacterized protein n=1 Tax=Steinernema carpocapsae TaxID=34508 RepID=A0A4U5N7K9_STECR|nr:hypothetical protein L596_019058 [Steinernema carpocapsae]